MNHGEAELGLPAPELVRVANARVLVGAPIDVGETPYGKRRLVPITGGAFYGPLLAGKVLPGGADFQLALGPELVHLHARYVLETTQKELVYIENEGVRTASSETLAAIQRGEYVDPALVYCRTRPRFETASPALAWLTTSTFVATARRAPDCVELSFFRVL